MSFPSFINKAEFINKRYLLLFIVKMLIAVGLLFYLITALNFNTIIREFKGAENLYLFIAIALLPVNLYLQYLKWKLTAEYLLEENNKKKIVQSMFVGFSAAVFTPARIGEYFGRAAAFKDKPLLQVTIATLLDKFFPLLCVAFFGSIASILFIHFYYNIAIYITISLFIILFVLFYSLVMLLSNEKTWDNILFNRIRSKPKLHKIFSRLRILKNLDRAYTVKMGIISIGFYFCFILQYSLLVSSFSHKQNIFDYMWAGNLIMFAKTVIPAVSLGELGIREGASIFFLSKMGEPEYVGFNASIFLFIINVLIPAVSGFLFLFRKNND